MFSALEQVIQNQNQYTFPSNMVKMLEEDIEKETVRVFTTHWPFHHHDINAVLCVLEVSSSWLCAHMHYSTYRPPPLVGYYICVSTWASENWGLRDGRIWSHTTQVLCFQSWVPFLLTDFLPNGSHWRTKVLHLEELLSQENKECARLKISLYQDVFILPHRKKIIKIWFFSNKMQ